MDTGTHLVVGLGLAGLSHLDPAVSADTTTASAVLLATVLGSNAPDSDSIYRLKSNAAYIRHHRGQSHSLPALVLWTLVITAIIALLFPSVSPWVTGKWALIGVVVHVFSDMFNTYGVQSFRPITEKWISWNIIHIFDPFIFAAHLIAIAFWVSGMDPTEIFPALYGVIVVYYIWRSATHYFLEKRLARTDPDRQPGDKYTLIPTVRPNIWNSVKRRADNSFVLGEMKNGVSRWVDRVVCSNHPAVSASRQHPDVESFLYFSSYACAELREHEWGYEVRWIDARYRHRKQYPFVAVVIYDKQLNALDSYVGWLSETKLEKRLKLHSL